MVPLLLLLIKSLIYTCSSTNALVSIRSVI